MTKEVTIEPLFWALRLVDPDGTEHPPYDAVVNVLKGEDGVARLTGALGHWEGHMHKVWKILCMLGFSQASMNRHGVEKHYDIHKLLRCDKERCEFCKTKGSLK
jgi:hypothetical protein